VHPTIPRLAERSLPVLLATALLACAALLGCATRGAAPPSPVAAKTVVSTTTTIAGFAVSAENLSVDMVGLRDGFLKPDGNRDLAFSASVNGPFDALFLVSTNAKGEPGYGLRADTLTGSDELPRELGGELDIGRMTVGIGVVEGGRYINLDSGAARGGPGAHALTLYVANTATLQAGQFVRLYVRTPEGVLLAGPVTPY
jgi:hypothetical protein